MFGVIQLEGYDAMLARIFKEELERIVSRYESSRMSALRELERRRTTAQHPNDLVASTMASLYMFSKPQQRGVSLMALDGARGGVEGGQRGQQSTVYLAPRT